MQLRYQCLPYLSICAVIIVIIIIMNIIKIYIFIEIFTVRQIYSLFPPVTYYHYYYIINTLKSSAQCTNWNKKRICFWFIHNMENKTHKKPTSQLII